MTSCLYKVNIIHHRFSPKVHRFYYKAYMFYINLDELELLSKKLFFFSINRFNFFSFKTKEHLQILDKNPDTTKSTKQHIISFLKENNFEYSNQKIMLLTNLNILGYNFNPVSFYFVLDSDNNRCCAIAEVQNTFGEMKPYFLSSDTLKENTFYLNTKKYFYVSPFIEHDANFDFKLVIPNQKLNIKIDTFKEDKKLFISTLTGIEKKLSNLNLFWYSIRFPFLTLRIIFLIHWNAALLWLKKIPYQKKGDKLNLQKNVYRKYKS